MEAKGSEVQGDLLAQSVRRARHSARILQDTSEDFLAINSYKTYAKWLQLERVTYILHGGGLHLGRNRDHNRRL